MFGWLRRAIGIEKCEIDHEFYYDAKKTDDRKIADLENIIKLKNITIAELNRHVEIQKTRFDTKYDNRTS